MAWAELTDSRCYYELIGQGEPLLLIPGLGATCRVWDPIVPELSRSFTLIMPDNRGMGRSEPRRKPTHLVDFTSDLIELLDHLQINRAHVLGLSLGGIIAQRLAIDHPARIDRLVLVSCAECFTPYMRQMAMLLAQALRRFPWPVFARTVEVLGTSPHFWDANVGLVEKRLLAKCACAPGRAAVAQQLRCLSCSEVDPEHYHITVPTLVMAGEQDGLIPACYARKMASRIAGGKFVLIPDAGHNPLEEDRERALKLVTQFLKEDRTKTARMAVEKDMAGLYLQEMFAHAQTH